MGRPTTKDLTERELEVMHVFWSSGELTAAGGARPTRNNGPESDVHNDRKPGAWAQRQGLPPPAQYRATVRVPGGALFEDVSGRLLGDLVQRVFRGSRAQLLCRLVDQRKLSKEERGILEQILKEEDR